jgi:radical SAM superfamily enzyme YgiQ (UPF0313 family)
MKVTFIFPGVGKKKNRRYINSWKSMEPLTFATLKALTPADIETELFDDRWEAIDYDTDTDLVAIHVGTFWARRSYMIADRFRERGIPVVMGGYHVMALPEEVKAHCDILFKGNAEEIWGTFLEDFRKGQYKEIYEGGVAYSPILPDRSIYNRKSYGMFSLVETGRGCCYHCDFCSINTYYKGKYHPRAVNDVVRDIESTGSKIISFVDDNIVDDPDYAIELFKAITPLKIKWFSQASLTMATNDELLKWMKKSGCLLNLIGYESINHKNLEEIRKGWVRNIGDFKTLTDKIHDYGMGVLGSFMFGGDNDDLSAFDATLDFSMGLGIDIAFFAHITPMPGTAYYDRLKEEGRLIYPEWWIKPDFHYDNIIFQPKNMTPEQLADGCHRVGRDFYKAGYVIKRIVDLLKRHPSLFEFFAYIFQNLGLAKEESQRIGLPLGENLDEMPK